MPISKDEWAEFARARPDLAVGGSIDSTDNSSQPIYLWAGPDGTQVSLHWFGGRINIAGVPNEEFASALVPVAAGLNASLIGDDDEMYE